MKKIFYSILILSSMFFVANVFAQETKKVKIILLVSEQNIEGPKAAWWASEVDLSATEATVAKRLIEQGYEIIEPSMLSNTVKEKPAFRMLNIGQEDSVQLGKKAKADYIVLGKAVASSGGNVPQSNMRSCFANITAKLIRSSDGKIIAYLEGSGNTAHMDVITGGKEALVNAGEDLAVKITEALNKAKETIKK